MVPPVALATGAKSLELEEITVPGLPDATYREQLLATMKSLTPGGFERLCQRLLRESGFEEVFVTGRSGDGGIDGNGVLKLNPFVSFRVYFQCKRYDRSVGPGPVRDFRGAMCHRKPYRLVVLCQEKHYTVYLYLSYLPRQIQEAANCNS